jgi:hypothetical protein
MNILAWFRNMNRLRCAFYNYRPSLLRLRRFEEMANSLRNWSADQCPYGAPRRLVVQIRRKIPIPVIQNALLMTPPSALSAAPVVADASGLAT